jgi:ribosomal-protein-serine acetyltransferase
MTPILIDLPDLPGTDSLIFRAARPGDGDKLCAAVSASHQDLRLWMPWAQQETDVEQSEATARRMHADFLARKDLPVLIFEREAEGGEGRVLGGTGLHRIDWTVPRFEIGYWRRSGHAGRGIAAAAVEAMTRLAFDHLQAQRVEIRMDSRNHASVRVAERAGYSFEGLLRQDSRAPDGSVRSTRVYARVRGIEEG